MLYDVMPSYARMVFCKPLVGSSILSPGTNLPFRHSDHRVRCLSPHSLQV